MLLSVQRIPQYQIMLTVRCIVSLGRTLRDDQCSQELLANTPEEHVDFCNLRQAVQMVQHSYSHANQLLWPLSCAHLHVTARNQDQRTQ